MSRSYEVSIDDICECLKKIQIYTMDIAENEFEINEEKQDAVIRRLEIIGEAVKNVPDSVREKYPEIPWRNLAGLRDVVIHQYFGVSIGMIWKVAKVDVPKLKRQFRKIKSDLKKK